MTVEPKTLKLTNVNNKFACNGFCVISFGPKALIKSEDYLQVWSVPNEHGYLLVKLECVLKRTFLEISDWHTIPANGMTENEWRRWWLKLHPDTTDETPMGVYYYVKIT